LAAASLNSAVNGVALSLSATHQPTTLWLKMQVWSWDITKLMGPAKWTYFYLYVIRKPGVSAPGQRQSDERTVSEKAVTPSPSSLIVAVGE
jgi:hypothetical protein